MTDTVAEAVILAEKISLRDYMAMSVLGGLVDKLYVFAPAEKIAKEAYKLADAMIKEGKIA